eukprot:CAMPEP_0177267862 /NCGR_PEP_ID=MMETSP0367-20130122/63488_1 /TAXON_ID=447022 ORGANISM="Scrippsiella hangoei-like, Strain SHHI-4" /NCGR_SAMPLE_ID=MMETSP0367 /ASSEMBLY_ACC=CAM_ASM_000362 /LENGTH=63 /DNA_ID=CAMNT_0018723415 /DNA_START=89 /DNA_END=281 /DNA_ORIENTATION=+
MALADARLVVAEHATGNIVVFDVATGFKIRSYSVTALDLMASNSPSAAADFGFAGAVPLPQQE